MQRCLNGPQNKGLIFSAGVKIRLDWFDNGNKLGATNWGQANGFGRAVVKDPRYFRERGLSAGICVGALSLSVPMYV